MAAAQPRGIRNNNPLNLKYNTTDKWQGLADNPSDGTFFVFKTPADGIRAGAITLIAYQDRHDCHTLDDLKNADGTVSPGFIPRWAPPTENNTAAYISGLSNYMKITAKAAIDVHQYESMRPMIEGMIQQENGGAWSDYYTSDILDKGLLMAGVQKPTQTLATSPQIVGGTIAAAATVAPSIMDYLHQAQAAIQPYIGTGNTFKYLFAALALAGIGYSIYAKWQERKRGIS